MSNYKKFATLAPLFLVLVIDTMGAGIIFPILGPLFMEPSNSILSISATLGERQFWYGIVLTSWALLMFIGSPYLGDLSDKLGRKKVLMLCLTGTAIGFVVSGFGIQKGSITYLIIGRLIAGFFAGSQPIAQAVIADVSDKQDKVLNMSLIILANCLGFVIGPIVGGYFADNQLVSWFSYSTPFYVAGLLALINASLLLVTLRETYQPKSDVHPSLLRGLTVFLEAFLVKKIRMHSLILFLVQLSWTIFFLYVPIYLVKMQDYNKIEIAHYMSYMGLVFGTSLTIGIRVFIRFLSLEWTVISVLGVMMLGCFLTPNFTGYNFWWITIPVAFGASISYSVMITLCSNLVDSDQQGWIMGITSSVVAAAFGVGSLCAGTLGSVSQRFPFDVAAALAVLSAILLHWKTHGKHARRQAVSNLGQEQA